MGQTQILMIIMAVVIVGIAVAVGISQLGQQSLDANKEAITNDCMTAISKAQMWYKKPTSMGGGGNDFSSLTNAKAGITTSTANGAINLNPDSATQITCTGTGVEKNDAGTAIVVTMVYTATTDATTTTYNF